MPPGWTPDRPARPPHPNTPSPASGVPEPPRPRWEARLAGCLVLVGALLRIRAYLSARSLWFDEALLGHAMQERSFAGLFLPLDYNQRSPLGFILLSKLSTALFGNSDLAVRLIPLLAGIAMLPVMYAVGRRLIGPRGALVALALAALSPPLLYYSNEFKQYSGDALWTLLVLLAVLPLFGQAAQKERGRDRRWWVAAIAGITAVWFSHPILFVLAGAGTALAVHFAIQRRWTDIARTLGLGAAWVASFGVGWLFLVGGQSAPQHLREALRDGFPPLEFWITGWARYVWQRLDAFLEFSAGYHFTWLLDEQTRFWARPPGGSPTLWIAGATGLLGAAALLVRRGSMVLLLLAPLGFMILASLARQYPLLDRFFVFALPLLYLAIGAGVAALWRRRGLPGAVAGALLSLALIGPYAVHAGTTLVRPTVVEEIKRVTDWVESGWRDGDVAYVAYTSRIQYEYYDMYAGRIRIPTEHRLIGQHVSLGESEEEIEPLREYDRIWAIFSHYYADDRDIPIAAIERIGRLVETFEAPGAVGYLYEVNRTNDASDETPD